MTGNQVAHITVHYKGGYIEGDAVFTKTYAISADLLCEALANARRTGRELREWLEDKGCQLDSSGGPAFVMRRPDGSSVEGYHRDGKPHREDGPAYVWRNADGTINEEQYFRDGTQYSPPYATPDMRPDRPRAPDMSTAPSPA
jgi:hypothetical protein